MNGSNKANMVALGRVVNIGVDASLKSGLAVPIPRDTNASYLENVLQMRYEPQIISFKSELTLNS
jgi:hypothetical protein